MLLTYLFFIVLCIVEAYLELPVIKLKSPDVPNYPYWNREEHRRSAIYYFTIIGYALANHFIALPWLWSFLYMIPLIIATLMVLRRIFFDGALRIFRKRPLKFIEGEGMIDNFSRRMFGYEGGIKELVLLLTFAIVLFFLTL